MKNNEMGNNKMENKLKTLLLIFNESHFLEESDIENLFSRFPVIQKEGIENLIVYIDFLDEIHQKEKLIHLLSENIQSVSKDYQSASKKCHSDFFLHCCVISDYENLPNFLEISKTSAFSVYFIFNLGGRDELKSILSTFIQKCQSGQFSASDMVPEFISSHLCLPFEPDFIISGSKNTLTDFMIWQTVYSEYFYFDKGIDRLTDSDFRKAFESFKKRGRRYGV